MKINIKEISAQPWFVVLMFFLFWTAPIGIYLMWKHKIFPKALRQIITYLSLATFFMTILSIFHTGTV